MAALKIGDVDVFRVEESYGPAFPADMLLPAFKPSGIEKHGADTFAQFMQLDTSQVLLSIHTWVIRTGTSVILVDTCSGNHKHRPAMETMHQLDGPYLDRLAAIGVQPQDVTHVVCTHLHLDHVGFNTSLVDGRWVPTFPNASYVFNQTEFEFWNPTNPASAPLEFNAGVYEDSVLPVFEAGLVKLWTGDHSIDDVFHLFETPGHTPGNAAGWLESKGQRALLAGDTMHSPMQVFEPSWNSGFDVDGPLAEKTRRSLLERCADKGAFLMPAHFSAPHAFTVLGRGDGFAAVGVL